MTAWHELRTYAEMFHDAQEARKAAVNRAARGSVDGTIYESAIEAFERAEHVIELEMWRCYRRVVPAELVAWQKAERGIGEHLCARLLGHLGDPYVATPAFWTTEPPAGHLCDPLRCGDGAKRHLVAGEPFVRTVSQLWSYCGHGDARRRPTRGMSADEALALGNPQCKMLLHLLAEATMKQKAVPGKYRTVYEKMRAKYDEDDHAHTVECRRCGPAGTPAQPGTPWSNAHRHASALRLVGKEILRDMWLTRHRAEACQLVGAPA